MFVISPEQQYIQQVQSCSCYNLQFIGYDWIVINICHSILCLRVMDPTYFSLFYFCFHFSLLSPELHVVAECRRADEKIPLGDIQGERWWDWELELKFS